MQVNVLKRWSGRSSFYEWSLEMPSKTLRLDFQLMGPVENLERLARRAEVTPTSCTDGSFPTWREEKLSDCEELMTSLLGKASNWINIFWDSLFMERMASDTLVEDSVNPTEVKTLMKYAITLQRDKLKTWVAQVTEDTLTGITKNIVDDHNIAFVRRFQKGAISSMLTFILNDKGGQISSKRQRFI